MKNVFFLLVSCGLLAVGCSSVTGSRSEYFGYKNTVRHNQSPSDQQPQANTQADATDNTVQQDAAQQDAADNTPPPAPAALPQATQSDNPFALTNTGNVYIENYYADEAEVEYVPVIVPWWERYYNPYYYHCATYRPAVVVRYGYYDTWCYNTSWYTPWYYYHPCYGWAYHPRVYYPPVVHSYPSYGHVSDGRTVKRRTFGSYSNSNDNGSIITPVRGTRSGTIQPTPAQDNNTTTRRAQRSDERVRTDVTSMPNTTNNQPVAATPETPRSRTDVTSMPNTTNNQPVTATPGTPHSRTDVTSMPNANAASNQPVTAAPETPRSRTNSTSMPNTTSNQPVTAAPETPRSRTNSTNMPTTTNSQPVTATPRTRTEESTTVQRRTSRSAETGERSTTTQRRPSRSAETTDRPTTTQRRPERHSQPSSAPAPQAPAAEPGQTTTRRGGRSR